MEDVLVVEILAPFDELFEEVDGIGLVEFMDLGEEGF